MSSDEQLATHRSTGSLEVVHTFHDAMPTGVTVSRSGRVFVCCPKWGDDVRFTVGEVLRGAAGGDVALETTYLNDVRFDLTVGEAGVAYVTGSAGSGPNGIVVVDLATGESWRRLHDHPSTKAQLPPGLRMVVERVELLERGEDGVTSPVTIGADGVRLYCCCLAGRRWWSVETAALRDRALSERAVAETVRDEGDEGSVGDGMETDDAGRLYVTDGEHDAIHRRLPDGHLYVTASQLHRQAQFRGGKDERRRPYVLFRTPVDAGPVSLR